MFGSNFYDAEAQSHADIQEEFGDMWTHRPICKKPNYSPVPDPSRPTYDLIGIFQWMSREIHLGMEEAGVSSRDPKLTLMKTNLQTTVINGDMFQRQSTGELFEVTDVKPDGLSGVALDLVQCGVQSGGGQ